MGNAINLPSRIVLILFAATLLTGLLFALPAGRRGIGKRLKRFVASKSAAVDQLMQPIVSERSPGAAVLVVQNGRVVHASGYGMADLTTGRPIDTDTSFELASVSKQFTATAIMLLFKQGRLQYETKLSQFLPEFSRFAQTVTVRHLLHHTSGLPEYLELPATKEQLNAKDFIQQLAASKLLFAPGERFDYCNSNYMLLARIVEIVSGESFPAFMQKRVFKPLAMDRSLVYDSTCPRITNQALAYQPSADSKCGFEELPASELDQIYGDGSVRSTVQDLAKWEHCLRRFALLGQATASQSHISGQLTDGTATGYGFGWSVHPESGLVEHSGLWSGYTSQYSRYLKEDLTIVVLSNAGDLDASEIAEQIATIYLDRSI